MRLTDQTVLRLIKAEKIAAYRRAAIAKIYVDLKQLRVRGFGRISGPEPGGEEGRGGDASVEGGGNGVQLRRPV